jgi:hypothetical protein
MLPLRLTDRQMSVITDAARHLRPRDRGRFLQDIAERRPFRLIGSGR